MSLLVLPIYRNTEVVITLNISYNNRHLSLECYSSFYTFKINMNLNIRAECFFDSTKAEIDQANFYT